MSSALNISKVCKGDATQICDIKLNDSSFHWANSTFSKTKDTCLHIVAQYSHENFLEFLITAFDPKVVDIRNADNKTPLHVAAQFGNLNCVMLLLSHGADINALKRADWTPLMLACTKRDEKYVDIVKYLLQKGAVLNFKNKDGWDALHIAARNKNPSILQLILDHDVDLNSLTKNRRNALHIAALHGNFENVKILLSKTNNINSVDSSGNSPFHESVLSSDKQIVDYLVACGADYTKLNKTGSTALHLASGAGLDDIIYHLVVNYEFNINSTDFNGYTPLHYALRKNHLNSYNLLIKLGAKTDIVDKTGRLAREYITESI